MAEVESSTLMLPWIWIIEAFASYKEVKPSFIDDVIEMVPQLRNDLRKSVLEMVALRYLECFYGPNNGSTDDVPFAMGSNVRLNPSESCENVLRFLLAKPPSDLRLAGGESLKVDICSFISHKRASMPKCTLEQLKDKLLDGTHPYAVTLKGLSGLLSANECHFDGGDHNAVPQAQRFQESGTMAAENNGDKLNLVPQTLENGHEQSEKLPLNINLSPCERDKPRMAAESVDVPKSQYVDKAKKHKHHDSSAMASEDGPCENFSVNGNTCVVEPQTSSYAAAKATQHEIHQSSGALKHGFQESSGSDGNVKERADISTTKNQFSSSQFLDHNSSKIAEATKLTLCVKCHEGGQLLVCRCNLVVHEKCLGISARFDDHGNFHCPFCTYYIATSEYLEGQKEASLAKSRLVEFIGSPRDLTAKEDNPRQRAKEDVFDDVVQKGHLGEAEGNQVDCTSDRVKSSHFADKQQSGSSLASHLKAKLSGRKMAGDKVDCTRDHVKKVSNNHVQQSTHDKQQSRSRSNSRSAL